MECEAQRIAAQLIARQAQAQPTNTDASSPEVATVDIQRVDIDSLALTRPRSVAVKQIGLWSMQKLGFMTLLSGLGELLDVDYETMSLMSLYRASDVLWKHHTVIEQCLFERVSDLFGLSTTVTLYDLTNTYFEGEVATNGKAKRGRSKEKRKDCPLVNVGTGSG